MERSPSPTAISRPFDIELSGQEVITVDLDNLDTDPSDLLDVLRESQCTSTSVWVWTKLAGEYWRHGNIDAAERIGRTGVETFKAAQKGQMLTPIYLLLANITFAHARQAPKIILQDARLDKMDGSRTKEQYYTDSAMLLNEIMSGLPEDSEREKLEMPAFLTRGIYQMSTRSMDDALRSFQSVLDKHPTNVIALLGKARILYAGRQYAQALKLFQQVLQLSPNCTPDPRIGIGLCFWSMGHKSHAKAAWERSAELHPTEWTTQLLLGLESINASKSATMSDEERASLFLLGTRTLERAFKANNKNATAANALCEVFLLQNKHQQALKLAERTIQFADTLSVLTEGHLRAARIAHAEGSLAQAAKHYTSVLQGQPKHILGSIGQAQVQMQNSEMAAAIHTLDTLIQPPNAVKSVEATLMLASLHSHPRPGVSSSDAAQERTKARELFDRARKALEAEASAAASGSSPSRRTIVGGDDVDMYAEMARLWQDEDLARSERALRDAVRTSEAAGRTDPRLLNNVAVIRHLEKDYAAARETYENALTSAAGLGSEVGEGLSTTILYNLARVYEDSGEEGLAKEAYEKLLLRHPEYIDAKIRQSHLYSQANQHNQAHELLKECLTSEPHNLNLRAYYTYFLLQTDMAKHAREFVYTTLKTDKHDVYALCATAWILYHLARESRDRDPKAVEERRRNFQRAADLYDKALQLDPACAVAAQGLAIIIAEDTLGSFGTAAAAAAAAGQATPEEHQKRANIAREALDIFGKVRESISDGSVYVNMGHCYYARDEFARAIESYETASTRYFQNKNLSLLLCLCRSWYAKATKEQSIEAMHIALKYAQRAIHIRPSDKTTLYNVAMIQQKAAEMLIGIQATKRTLEELQRAVDGAAHAQQMFASLAADKSQILPYSREMADQRRKYGDSLKRRGDEQLAIQRDFEADAQAKLNAARQRRQAERDQREADERKQQEELRRQAEEVAEERRKAVAQAQEWSNEMKMMESDEDREKKTKKAARSKVKAEPDAVATSGDEGGGEPQKKRRRKLRKGGPDVDPMAFAPPVQGEESQNEEPDALFSDEEGGGGGSQPVKKRNAKKRVVRDDDDEGEASVPRKKQSTFKSKEVLSDTDDEMGE